MDHPISAPAFGLSKAGSERKPSVGRESHKISTINIEDTEEPSPIKSDNFYQNNHENNSFLNISPSDEASSYQISNSVIITYSILIIAVCAVGFVLQYLQEVLVPFVVAVFLYYLIKPLVAFMTRPFKIYWFSILIPDEIDSAYEGISNDSSYDGLLEGRRHSRSSSHHTRNPDAEYIAEAMSHIRSEEVFPVSEDHFYRLLWCVRTSHGTTWSWSAFAFHAFSASSSRFLWFWPCVQPSPSSLCPLYALPSQGYCVLDWWIPDSGVGQVQGGSYTFDQRGDGLVENHVQLGHLPVDRLHRFDDSSLHHPLECCDLHLHIRLWSLLGEFISVVFALWGRFEQSTHRPKVS